MILCKIKEGVYSLLFSPVHLFEIEAIPDDFERFELQILLEKLGAPIKADLTKTRTRAEELTVFGFGVADAAHIAFAEAGGAQFISCDDKLNKKCLNYKINVWCGNPVVFCEKENLR